MNLKLEQLDLFQMKENVTNDSWEGFFFISSEVICISKNI